MTDLSKVAISISETVVKAVKEDITKIGSDISISLSEMHVNIANLMTRLDVIENIMSQGAKAPRVQRATSSAVAGVPGADEPLGKIKNAMLWFKSIYISDNELIIENFGKFIEDKEIMKIIETDSTILKKAAGSNERKNAEALFIWKKFGEVEKDKARHLFGEWKNKILTGNPQMSVDV